jgi:molybdopterin-guanine dinucleotide biosynthesis protein A
MRRQSTRTHVPGMLLIGSTGRNVGKTALACEVIRRFREKHPIIGLKVTVIREDDSGCPRGSEGCGVCASLDAPFLLTEETNRDGRKDTSRLLLAGANRVYWLRVRSSCLQEGVTAMLEQIGPGALTVCESNSLRHAVRPGLFLMVSNGRTGACKATARAVMSFADRVVVSDGDHTDMPLDDLSVTADAWHLREHATAIIMAGGDSTRMGQDKGLLLLEGRPLLARLRDRLVPVFDEVLVSANDPARYAFLGVPVIPDRIPAQGPLMGLASALEAASRELALVVACDIPEPDMNLAHRMLARADGFDAVVPRLTVTGTSHRRTPLEPLFAVYRKRLAPTLRDMLNRGERRVRPIVDHCRALLLDIDAEEAPLNLNTMGEYRDYVAQQTAVTE